MAGERGGDTAYYVKGDRERGGGNGGGEVEKLPVMWRGRDAESEVVVEENKESGERGGGGGWR